MSDEGERVRVLLADEQIMFRQAVRGLIEKINDSFEVVAEAGNGPEALFLIRKHAPDLVVIETLLPQLSGAEVARRAKAEGSTARFLFLSVRREREDVQEAIKAGADGYVCKTDPPNELVGAVETVSRGLVHFSPLVARHLIDMALGAREGEEESSHLTSREREVLKRIAEGQSSRQIAQDLDISTRTVDSHRAKLMEKLGVRNVSGLVRYAIREGLVSP
jgi:DNA-binding NarL/FixJ family response regulator